MYLPSRAFISMISSAVAPAPYFATPAPALRHTTATSAELMKHKLAELKILCSVSGMKTGGTKPELVARLEHGARDPGPQYAAGRCTTRVTARAPDPHATPRACCRERTTQQDLLVLSSRAARMGPKLTPCVAGARDQAEERPEDDLWMAE